MTEQSQLGQLFLQPIRTVSQESVVSDLADVGTGEAFAAAYDLGKVIGRGAFSVVRLGRHKARGEDFAVKIIDKMVIRRKVGGER
jgi:serine/threonine protein kinase